MYNSLYIGIQENERIPTESDTGMESTTVNVAIL